MPNSKVYFCDGPGCENLHYLPAEGTDNGWYILGLSRINWEFDFRLRFCSQECLSRWFFETVGDDK